MQAFFLVGAVAGWLLVSLFAGHLMPALSLPTIIAVVVGGGLGQIMGIAIAGANKQNPKGPNKKT